MEKKRILFVSQEIYPFLAKTEISHNARKLPQGTQENGKEIRVFTPRFGSINERRHQLHEVIRLSGMNIIIDDNDHPLIIKVASIPAARLQVYFIDNDEFFKRKTNVADDKGADFTDNDERSMFFCRGVLETVKKLGWKPDVIHCHGWMTSLMPLYIKKIYNKDPHFADTKVVYSIYDHKEGFESSWDERFHEKLKFDGFDEEVTNLVKSPTLDAITKAAVTFSDGVVQSSEAIPADLQKVYDEATCLKLNYLPEEHLTKGLSEFFDKVIEEGILIQ
ncbi:glycogen/starch synthase [Fluviicola sp.]|uniref:glycogen/starch synthase n=1 Tax=Fluviicola sp. TaxID=1917219 RepID=UPI002602F80D|nr:glycogen/starch synthase [Fluviicola sp.]